MDNTTITLESSYKEKRLQLILNVFLAFIMGPFIIFIMIHTAVMNKVDDTVSWIVLGISSILFLYLSYGKFKYIYFTYFNEHNVKIDYENKTILFLPYNETILIEKIVEFIYSKKLKKYIFRYGNHTTTFFEVKQNNTFESALLKCNLKCKVE